MLGWTFWWYICLQFIHAPINNPNELTGSLSSTWMEFYLWSVACALWGANANRHLLTAPWEKSCNTGLFLSFLELGKLLEERIPQYKLSDIRDLFSKAISTGYVGLVSHSVQYSVSSTSVSCVLHNNNWWSVSEPLGPATHLLIKGRSNYVYKTRWTMAAKGTWRLRGAKIKIF